jgi:hypothetical protein
VTVNQETITESQLMAPETSKAPTGFEVALIDRCVVTAREYPRDLEKIVADVMLSATMDIDIAGECFYSLERKGADGVNVIEGPSVRLAELFVQQWGNLRADTIIDDPGPRDISAHCVVWDMEKNTMMKVTAKRGIMGRKGRYGDDMIRVTGQAAASVAYRNAVWKVIPMAFVRKVMGACKGKIRGDNEDSKTPAKETIAQRRTKAVKFWNSLGISNSQIFAKFGIDKLSKLTGDHLVRLAGGWNAIREGQTNLDGIFPEIQGDDDQEQEKDDPKAALKAKQDERAKLQNVQENSPQDDTRGSGKGVTEGGDTGDSAPQEGAADGEGGAGASQDDTSPRSPGEAAGGSLPLGGDGDSPTS